EDKLQLLYPDVPYAVAYDNKSRPLRNDTKKQWGMIANDDLSQADYERFLKQSFVNMIEFFDKSATGYVWNGYRQFYFMHQVLTELDCHVSSLITWAKETFAPSFSPYHWQTENCLYFWKNNNGAHKWHGNRKQSNLWYASRDDARRLEHPTQKPVSLATRAIKNSSKKGDIVADFFAGSGSTLVAAEKLGRKSYCIDISPAFCDSIVYRFARLVGMDKLSGEIRAKYFKETKNGK
ncbi:MAG: site-specific DNA-methyltransferase, partial [Candidatus Omnitrophica bacterium]|nr:site-specific DNA-methyltransferase [Candidatus Omnitrophota bacterium]